MLIIGSVALNKAIRAEVRKPRDIDCILPKHQFDSFTSLLPNCKKEELGKNKWKVVSSSGVIYEVELVEDGSSGSMLHRRHPTASPYNWSYATLDELYTIKMSHRYLKNSPAFNKTMDDITLLRYKGAKITGDLKPIYELRQEETYTYKHPKLSMSKKDFFTDSVKYVYDHDSIHRAIAFGDNPAYLSFKPDQNEVLCSKSLWDKLPSSTQLYAVVEESAVLALERSVVPFNTDFDRAYKIALSKVCTSITSGWFREFAWENYYFALQYGLYYGDEIMQKFHKGIKEGIVVKHEY